MSLNTAKQGGFSLRRTVRWPLACDRGARQNKMKGASILSPDDAQIDVRSLSSLLMAMRTTVTLDDELLARAEQLCGPLERSALLRQALQALVQRESAKRLAALGGSDPALDPVPRRRSAP